MKKKILSITLALALLLTLLPLPATAAGSTASSGETTSPPESLEGPLLVYDVCEDTHPTHLTDGEISITRCINKEVKYGILAFSKGKATTTGSVKLKSWSVDNDGKVHFSVSGARKGDTITFPVTVISQYCGTASLRLVVTIGYSRPTMTCADTVTYGSSLKLTCAGLTDPNAVIYEITSGKECAQLNGNILTPIKVGTVTVRAMEVPVTGDDSYSERFTITIVPATPAVSVTCTTLEHAGQKLSHAELRLNGNTIPGRLEWILPSHTLVLPNVAYEWKFIPTDHNNYKVVTGTLTPYVMADEGFVIGSGVTVRNDDGSYTTVSYDENDSRRELTEYPDGSLRMVHRRLDGVTVTTIENADGTRVYQTENADGSSSLRSTLPGGLTYFVSTDRYGAVEVQVSLPSSLTASAAKNGSVIELPIPEIPCTDDRADAPAIVFTISTKSPVRVSIPINSPTAGTVAILVDKNGQETVVKTSVTGKDSLLVTLTGSTTLKIADVSKRFNDVSQKEWFHDAADFVSARGLFQGMDAVTFAPNATMSRAMLVKVLHNLEDNPMYGIFPFYTDIVGTWYADSASWASYCGYINGFPDGTFRGEEAITREQLAAILYRYLGYPSVSDFVNTPIYSYYDYADINPYAWTAMYWAVNSGVLYTAGSTHLAPGSPVTRAEVAQTLSNLVRYMTQ